jgi:hypothetical protein
MVYDDCPVPPPPTPRSPASVFAKVSVEPEPVTVVDAVSPLNAVEDVAMVTAGPVVVCPVGPIEVRAAVRYVEVSIESVPLPPDVFTNPFEVRLESVAMFCDVFTEKLPGDPALYERPVPAVVVDTHAGTPFAQVSVCPPVPVPKREEVATAVTLPVAPVAFASTVFAAICGSWVSERAFDAIPMVTLEPPICEPKDPEVTEMPVPTEMDEVPTDATVVPPAPPYKI